MLIYFAGPADAVEPGGAAIQERLRKALSRAACQSGEMSVFFPQSAFAVGTKDAAYVQAINNAALLRAGAVVVDLITPARRVGTLMEMGWALGAGIPVVALQNRELAGHLALQWEGLHTVEVNAEDPTKDMESVVAFLSAVVRASKREPEPPEVVFEAVREIGGVDVPTRAYAGDAGFDIPVGARTVVPPGQFVDVPLAFRLAPAPGYWYRLVGRSSTLRKLGLLVNEGIIDEGYRGPLFAGVWNMTSKDVTLEVGQRIAQIIPHRLERGVVIREVPRLRPGDRGENGFGSTGA